MGMAKAIPKLRILKSKAALTQRSTMQSTLDQNLLPRVKVRAGVPRREVLVKHQQMSRHSQEVQDPKRQRRLDRVLLVALLARAKTSHVRMALHRRLWTMRLEMETLERGMQRSRSIIGTLRKGMTGLKSLEVFWAWQGQ